MTRLGFIGLGTMGHGMALNLLMAGNTLDRLEPDRREGSGSRL